MDIKRFKNIAAEQNILGSILNTNNVLIDVVDKLESNDFYSSKHMIIYNAMYELYKENKQIDITTLYNKLGSQITEVGGLTYLSELIAAAMPRHIKEHTEIVKEKSKMRNLKNSLEKTLDELYNSGKTSSDLVNTIQNLTLNLSHNLQKDTLKDSELMEKTLNIIQANYEAGGDILGLKTGINTLDRAINGLQKKKLYIIAGRPGMAKSAFALNIAQKISETKNVLYYSLEMAEEELGLRRLAMASFIDSAKIERGKLEDTEWSKIANTANFISSCKCNTNCTPAVHINTVRADCKRMQIQQGIDALIIDYIGIMSMKNMGDSIREQITNLCIQLKNIAKEFDIPVIALSQLSRGVEARADKRPMLSDLKESGGVEENADVVMLLYRDEYYNKETEFKNLLEVDIAKQRGGRTGRINLAWLPQYQKVADAV